MLIYWKCGKKLRTFLKFLFKKSKVFPVKNWSKITTHCNQLLRSWSCFFLNADKGFSNTICKSMVFSNKWVISMWGSGGRGGGRDSRLTTSTLNQIQGGLKRFYSIIESIQARSDILQAYVLLVNNHNHCHYWYRTCKTN